MRKKVELGIINELGIKDVNVESLFVDGNDLFNDGNVPKGYIRSTNSSINAVYFFPKQITTDNKNKLYIIGNTPDHNMDGTDWLLKDFPEKFKKYNDKY